MSQKVEIEIFECSERLPEFSVEVLGYYNDPLNPGPFPVVRFNGFFPNEHWFWHDSESVRYAADEITHWFFPPELPQAKWHCSKCNEIFSCMYSYKEQRLCRECLAVVRVEEYNLDPEAFIEEVKKKS